MYILKKSIIGLLFFLCLSMAHTARGQDSQSGSSQDDSLKEPSFFFNSFLDWVVVSYATYSGEMDAEAASFFSKVLDKYKTSPVLTTLLNDLDDGIVYNAIDENSRDFFNQTGIRIYFVGKLDNNSEKRYLNAFNQLLEEKLTTKSQPYIIVRSILKGAKSEGYETTVEVEASQEMNLSKYNLNAADERNPFASIRGTFSQRGPASKSIKEGALSGLSTLAGQVSENFLPNLTISYEGDYYKSSEEIEVAAEKDQMLSIYAVNKEGETPNKTVEWTITPQDDVSSQVVIIGNRIDIPGSKAGEYTLTAKSGNNEVSVILKLVQFDFDIKEIIKEILKDVVNQKIGEAREKAKALEAAAATQQTQIDTDKIVLLEREGYPTTSTSNGDESEIYFEEIEDVRDGTAQELTALKSDETSNNYIEAHRKWYVALASLALELNVEAFLNGLIDDPDNLERFGEEIVNSSPELVAILVANLVAKPENRTQLKEIVINYINEQINEVYEND